MPYRILQANVLRVAYKDDIDSWNLCEGGELPLDFLLTAVLALFDDKFRSWISTAFHSGQQQSNLS